MAIKCGRCRGKIEVGDPQAAAIDREKQQEIIVCGHCAQRIAMFTPKEEG